MRRRLALAVALLLTVSLAACGDDDDDDTAVGDDTTTTTAATDTTAPETSDDIVVASTVQVASSDLGDHLVDEEGFTLYVFTQDSGGTSACTDGCATAWPPLVADGEATAGEGADAALLGTIDRGDGTMQVTYNGRPLYRYGNDGAPGDTNGHAVGDVWFMVSPAGEPVS